MQKHSVCFVLLLFATFQKRFSWQSIVWCKVMYIFNPVMKQVSFIKSHKYCFNSQLICYDQCCILPSIVVRCLKQQTSQKNMFWWTNQPIRIDRLLPSKKGQQTLDQPLDPASLNWLVDGGPQTFPVLQRVLMVTMFGPVSILVNIISPRRFFIRHQ